MVAAASASCRAALAETTLAVFFSNHGALRHDPLLPVRTLDEEVSVENALAFLSLHSVAAVPVMGQRLGRGNGTVFKGFFDTECALELALKVVENECPNAIPMPYAPPRESDDEHEPPERPSLHVTLSRAFATTPLSALPPSGNGRLLPPEALGWSMRRVLEQGFLGAAQGFVVPAGAAAQEAPPGPPHHLTAPTCHRLVVFQPVLPSSSSTGCAAGQTSLIGLLTQTDVIDWLRDRFAAGLDPQFASQPVGDAFSRQRRRGVVLCAGADDILLDALHKMLRCGLQCAPVVDPSPLGRSAPASLLGALRCAEELRGLSAQGLVEALALSVRDFLAARGRLLVSDGGGGGATPDSAVAVPPSAPLGEVVAALASPRKCRAVFVVDPASSNILQMITPSDVLRLLVCNQEADDQQPPHNEVVTPCVKDERMPSS